MPKFSVIYMSYRPGGYDLLAASLVHQSCQDYELICVDDMPGRRELVTRYLEGNGVKLKTVCPSKKKSFDVAYNLANVYNTGIMLSEGDYLVFLQDYAWLPEDALAKFEARESDLKQGVVISGVGLMLEDSRPRFLDRPISIWDNGAGSDALSNVLDGSEIHSVWCPTELELFYACASWPTLVRTNGMLECYDHATGTLPGSFIKQLQLLGLSMDVDHANICYMYNHRDWGKGVDEATWWLGNVKPQGSTELVARGNPFHLASHKRGTIKDSGGTNMTQKPPGEPNKVIINMPFKEGGKILEIGGGDQPMFHPNMDMRKLPTVDIVCDLEGRWPVADGEYEGLFGKFVIEHVSWRNMPHFVSECFRILKPGGAVMMIGPNTLEQCKEIAKLNRIGIEESSLLFGGQEERGWNEHKAAFSPEYAIEVFKKGGFDRVETETWPGQIWTGARTDMIIRAYKGGTAMADKKPVGAGASQEPPRQGGLTDASWFKELETKMETNPQPAVVKKIGLNIGSFTVMTKSTDRTEWVNYDIIDLTSFAQQNGFAFIRADVRNITLGGMPELEYADFIIASHFLEHISRNEGDAFLKKCFKALKPGGVLRITVPDTKLLAREYSSTGSDEIIGIELDSGIKKIFSFNEGVKNARDECEAFWNLLTAGHVTAYDEESLALALARAGFPSTNGIFKCDPGESNSLEIKEETVDMYPELSVYIEGVKPAAMIGGNVPKPAAAEATTKPPYRKTYQQYLAGEFQEGKQ